MTGYEPEWFPESEIHSKGQDPRGYRVAGDSDAIYIDLGDIGALPEPERGGSVKELRPFLNIDNEDDDAWRLVVGWLIACFRPGFPFSVLELHGEAGAGKTTFTRVLRSMIDPNRSTVRVAPRDVDDLMVGARQSWVVAYDNISRLTPSLSDALCRLSTGGGLSKRTLYTDADEILLDAMRPVILNGIEEVASRSDLLDRAVIVELQPISEESRKPEETFWREFEAARPMILGAICDAVSVGLARVDDVQLDRLPRMADFEKWVVAAEPALDWRPGSFMSSYSANRASVHQLAIDSSSVGALLLQIAEKGFRGTAGELGAQLERRADERTMKRDDWPNSARAVSGAVTRLASNLRAVGVEITQVDRSGQRVELKTQESKATLPLPRSAAVMLLEHKARSEYTGPRSFVFCTRSGRPLGQRNVLRALYRAQALARASHGTPTFAQLFEQDERGHLDVDDQGRYLLRKVPRKQLPPLPDVHALRHTAAMDCDDAEEARDLLRHKTSNVTRAVYRAHFSGKRRETLRSRMEARMEAAEPHQGAADGDAHRGRDPAPARCGRQTAVARNR